MSLRDLLAELKRDYLSAIPVKIANIQKLLLEGKVSDLETEFHKMKGTGRTYGLPEITQVGEAMEKICEFAPESAAKAVPIAVALLDRVRMEREQGRILDVEANPDFHVLIALVPRSSEK